MRWNLAVLGGMLAVCSGAGCQLVIGIGDWVEASGGTGGGTAGGGAGGTGGVTTGGTGGTGGASCTPGEKVACYTGPAGTEGVGTCKGGMATCNDQGTGYGGCEGQVVPGPEVPDAIGDEACDGYAPGEPVWWRTFGDDKDQWPDAIASDGLGNTYVCGTFLGKLTLDAAAPLDSAGLGDVFLFKLDANGKAVWAKRFGDAADQQGCLLAADGQGVVIAGNWKGTMYFGGTVFDDTATRNYVARFDPAGAHIWSTSVAYSPDDRLKDIGLLAGSHVLLVGWRPNSNQDGGSDAYAAKLFADSGLTDWIKLISDDVYTDQTGFQTALSVSTSPTGFAVGGQFTVPQGAGQGMTVYRYGNDGVLASSKEYPITGAQGDDCGLSEPLRVAIGPTGEDLLSGLFYCTLHMDAFSYDGPTDQLAIGDGFLAKVEGNWSVPWARHYVDPAIAATIDIDFDANGNVFLGAWTFSSVDLGGGESGPNAAGGNAVLGKLTGSGDHVWTRTFRGGLQGQPRIATAPDGGLVFTASYKTNIEIPTQSIPSAGARDLVVAKIAP